MDEIFNILRTYIGKEMICTYYHNNEEHIEQGELKDIIDYKAIIIGKKTLPFLGLGIAIKRIETPINQVVFENNNVDINYKNESPEELEEKKIKLFGEDYFEKYKKPLLNKYIRKSEDKPKIVK